VDHPSVSRRHAEIHVQQATLTVRDLGSRNGTFVNGLRIEAEQVRSGQVVRFGDVAFVAVFEENEASVDSSETKEPARKEQVVQELTSAQRRVFDLLVAGLTEKTISQQLHLSAHTVHSHTKEIYRSFQVHSRCELLALLMEKRPPSGKIASNRKSPV
jgi:pSer/pThr/pTyr-binding forkhead associated (FHA) protein